MKVLTIVFIAATILMSCNNKEKDQKASTPDIQVVEMSIDGMTCNGCEKTIEANVMKLDGVKNIKANHETGKASLEYDASSTELEKVKSVIADKGYKVTGIDSKEKVSKE